MLARGRHAPTARWQPQCAMMSGSARASPTEPERAGAHDSPAQPEGSFMNVSQRLLFLALASASSAVMAADAERPPPTLPAFVSKASQAGMTEVEVGKLALQKSKD